MANREQRSNKEKRKPKSDKDKAKPAGASASPFADPRNKPPPPIGKK